MVNDDAPRTVRGTSRATDGTAPVRVERDRVCADVTCSTRLSVYNQLDRCWIHQDTRPFAVRGRRTHTSNAA